VQAYESTLTFRSVIGRSIARQTESVSKLGQGTAGECFSKEGGNQNGWSLREKRRLVDPAAPRAVIEGGKMRSVLRAKRLGLVTDFPPKRHRGKDGKDVPNEILRMGSEICTVSV